MLTKTSENAIQILLYLALRDEEAPVAPKTLADDLGASPSYVAKITGLLVKAGILTAHRGTHGGVTLDRRPGGVTLLEIVEAAQGKILGDYCTEGAKPGEVCAFHAAMLELHRSIVDTLHRWTLGDLMKRPEPAAALRGKVPCRIACAVVHAAAQS